MFDRPTTEGEIELEVSRRQSVRLCDEPDGMGGCGVLRVAPAAGTHVVASGQLSLVCQVAGSGWLRGSER